MASAPLGGVHPVKQRGAPAPDPLESASTKYLQAFLTRGCSTQSVKQQMQHFLRQNAPWLSLSPFHVPGRDHNRCVALTLTVCYHTAAVSALIKQCCWLHAVCTQPVPLTAAAPCQSPYRKLHLA